MTRKKSNVVPNTQPKEVLEPLVEVNEVLEPVEKPIQEPKVSVKGVIVPLTNKAMAMKQILDAEPKVHTFIPLGGGENIGVTQPVTINGYPMYIPKGVNIEVPLSVKEVLDVKMRQQNAVSKHAYNITGGNKQPPLTQYGG